jgi:hypothetical protein
VNRSRQELQLIYDSVSMHMLQQCAKSFEGDMPRYRTADGRKCCVGFLILDAVYRDILEGKSIHSEFVKIALKQSGVDVDNPNLFRLLVDLQDAHDNYEIPEWSARLVEIAGQFGLDDTEVLRSRLHKVTAKC